MHVPEALVKSGKLSALGSNFSIRVDFSQRKMPEDKSQLVAEMLLDGLDDRVSRAAMRALVVANKSNSSILVTWI